MSRLAHVPVRWSWLRAFAQSAAHALHAATHGKDATPCMKLGNAGHAASFEPWRVVEYKGGEHTTVDAKGKSKTKLYSAVKNGACWDAFRAAQKPDAVIVTAKELAHAQGMAAALRLADAERVHPITGEALPLLFGPDVLREQRIAWSRNGRACTSTPDARLPGRWIADLKVARTGDPERYPRDSTRQGYPAQLVMYAEADAHERTGDHRDTACEMYSVVVEPFAPYVVTTYRLMPSAVEAGERMYALWWESLNACEAIDHWPGYVSSVAEFHVDDPMAMMDSLGGDPDPDADDADAASNTETDWSA